MHLRQHPRQNLQQATVDPATVEQNVTPTAEPTTVAPTATPTAEPTPTPTVEVVNAAQNATPTAEPTTAEPTATPTVEVTTVAPTATPTAEPTTAEPTATPTVEVTTEALNATPTAEPTTVEPTATPTPEATPLVPTEPAKIWTDKADYFFFEFVTIYGTGFTPDATVTVTLSTPTAMVREWTVVADGTGAFETQYTAGLGEPDYIVSATDGTITASTVFTDAIGTSTTLNLINNGDSLIVGESYQFAGKVTPGSSTIPAGASVKLLSKTGNCNLGIGTYSTTEATVFTVLGGGFSGTFTPLNTGSYCYVAEFQGYGSGSGGFQSSSSITVPRSNEVIILENTAPVADAQSVTTAEDTAKAITLTASDVDGDSLSYSIVDAPTHGSLSTITKDGVTYTPSADYNGADSFTFKANDGYSRF